MKKYFLIVLFVFHFNTIHSCSCHWDDSFCETAAYSHSLIATGHIVDVDSTRLILKILEIFKGSEARDTITIWADVGFDCNGWVSGATHLLGSAGQDLVIILSRIDSIQNPWDVLGDYRRPYTLCPGRILYLINDTQRGAMYIPSNPLYPEFSPVYALPLENFKSLWSDGTINCTPLSLTKNFYKASVDIRISGTNLVVNTDFLEDAEVRIFNLLGQELIRKNISGIREIPLPPTVSGLLIISLSSKGEPVKTIKAIKMH